MSYSSAWKWNFNELSGHISLLLSLSHHKSTDVAVHQILGLEYAVPEV